MPVGATAAALKRKAAEMTGVPEDQSQRDDRDAGRPIARKIRPLPAWANFEAVGVRGERDSK